MSRFKIPNELKTAVTARLRQTGMKPRDAAKRYNEFVKWFKSHVRENRLTQKEYSQLADIFEDAGIQKPVKSKGQRRQSLNLSHLREFSPYSTSDKPGSGLNFLENWYLNQKRGNKKLLQDNVMDEAGLPKTWEELYYAWDLQTQGKVSSLGKLENINPDDIIALHRGDPVNKVFERRERINQILEDAEEDSTTITLNSQEYSELIAKARGLNPNDPRNISLRDDAGWDLGQFGNYVRKDEFEIEADAFATLEERRTNPLSIRDVSVDYDSEEGDIIDKDLQYISDIKTGWDKHYDKYEQLEIVPDEAPKHKLLQNPLANIPKSESNAMAREANKPLRQLRNKALTQMLDTIFPVATPIVEPILNKIGNIEDKRLGVEIKEQDKDIAEAYKRITQSPKIEFSQEFYKQMDLLYPDE